MIGRTTRLVSTNASRGTEAGDVGKGLEGCRSKMRRRNPGRQPDSLSLRAAYELSRISSVPLWTL